jgi:O-6-methylguanine DNA methyltransferase
MTRHDQISYWATDNDLLGRLRLAASDAGLCRLALGRESDEAFHAWLARLMQPARLVRQRRPLIDQALAELDAYLCGALRTFETPLDLRGTPFQRRVWAKVARVPYGATTSYGEIAARIGRPRAARAVGAANGANPLPLFVPCHRVVGADGALRGYGGGLKIKAALLQLESGAADSPTRSLVGPLFSLGANLPESFQSIGSAENSLTTPRNATARHWWSFREGPSSEMRPPACSVPPIGVQ